MTVDMVDRSKTQMNLSSIKKIDPYAKDIIDSSPHVVFYTFETSCNEWEKTDVEGALFIYRRNAEPYYNIFINNRLNISLFVEPITSELELISQPPFLLYRNGGTKVYGFWFYDKADCDRLFLLLQCLIRNVQIREKSNLAGKVHGNILQMLGAARYDYIQAEGHNIAENAPEEFLKFFPSTKLSYVKNSRSMASPANTYSLNYKKIILKPKEHLVKSHSKQCQEVSPTTKPVASSNDGAKTDNLHFSEFVRAFTYLLHNNEEFPKALYNAYLESSVCKAS